MFRFFRRKPQREYTVLGRRYLVPVNKQPVFRQFIVEAASPYEAARIFDQTYTAWTRIDVTEA